MNHFNSLLQKILNWDEHHASQLHIYGADTNEWSFILNNLLMESAHLFLKKSHLIITSSNDEAEELYQSFENQREYFKNSSMKYPEILYYPGLDASPYSGIMASEKNFYDRFLALNSLLEIKNKGPLAEKYILISSFEALSLKIPNPDFFKEFNFTLNVDDIIAPIELAKKLVANGYSSATSVEEPGTFIQKGQIFDIFPVASNPVRLSYFDDLIESIHEIDIETQKTQKEKTRSSVTIVPAARVLTSPEFSVTLRENLPQYGPNFKNKFELRKSLFRSLSDGLLFENYPTFLPLFF